MTDYISREELIKALETDYNSDWSGVEEYVEGTRDEYDDVLTIVCGMKAADVQPIRHGRWIGINEYCKKNGYIPSGMGIYYWCSECGKEEPKISDYCPNCLAKEET